MVLGYTLESPQVGQMPINAQGAAIAAALLGSNLGAIPLNTFLYSMVGNWKPQPVSRGQGSSTALPPPSWKAYEVDHPGQA